MDTRDSPDGTLGCIVDTCSSCAQKGIPPFDFSPPI